MTLSVLPGDPAGQDVSDARHAPALRLDRIQEHLLDAFYAGRSANTVRAYRRDHEDFRTFVARQDGLAAFAATAEQAVRMLLAVEHGQPIGLTAGQAGIIYVTPGAANADITGLHASFKPGLLVAFTIAGPAGAVWRIPYTIRNAQWVSLGVPMREA